MALYLDGTLGLSYLMPEPIAALVSDLFFPVQKQKNLTDAWSLKRLLPTS